MINAGRAKAKSGNRPFSGKTIEDYSPNLRRCLARTRALHILEYDPLFSYPVINRERVSNIGHIILYHIYKCKSDRTKGPSIDLKRMPILHLLPWSKGLFNF